MKKIRRGFTLVEVSLFLALTAAVFVGIAVGTQNSIFQQRYNDSVQSFAEFLRTVYSQVKNVQSNGSGNSQKAIYGKLVTFGENINLSGGNNNEQAIFAYNVIGDVKEESETGNVIDQLTSLNVNVVNVVTEEDGSSSAEFVGFTESYTPRWGSKIQTTSGWRDGTGYENFTGTLLIVRHPSSGAIYTRFSDNTVQVNETLQDGDADNTKILSNALESFTSKQVDFCVNPNGTEKSNLRRDIRLVKGIRNASGIEIVTEGENWIDSDGTGTFTNIGNQCEP